MAAAGARSKRRRAGTDRTELRRLIGAASTDKKSPPNQRDGIWADWTGAELLFSAVDEDQPVGLKQEESAQLRR